MSPVVLALCSAFLFAVAVQLHNLGLRHIDSRRGTLISISSSAALYWVLSPWFLESWYWFTTGAALFAAIGLFRPFRSANFAMAKSVQHPELGEVKVLKNAVNLSSTPDIDYRPTPERGEHTDIVLAEFGFSAEEIEQLRIAGVI